MEVPLARPSKPRFRTLAGKVQALCLVPVLLFLLFFAFQVPPSLPQAVRSAKKDGIRETAQARGREILEHLRYDGTNHLWIQASGPRIVADPRNSDLSRQIPVLAEDEIGEAARAFNDSNSAMRKTVMDASEYATRVASGSTVLAATVQEIAKTSEALAHVAEGLRAVVQGFRL